MSFINNILGVKKLLIFLVLIVPIFLLVKITLFASDLEVNKGYNLYKERVETICEPYKPEKVIFNTSVNNYLNIEKEKKEIEIIGKNYFLKAKNLYKDNMNNIYKCMILNSQIKSLELISIDLIKNNPVLNREIKFKISEKIRKLQLSFNALTCTNISKEHDSIQKLVLLKQTTYELCKYHSYLEYLREYNSNFENLDLPDDNSYNTNYIVELEKERKDEINNEIAHIYKIFPIAFAAYNQYENNVTIHLLLELIKEDYIVFREALHKSINPINQVVYKISNAMKID